MFFVVFAIKKYNQITTGPIKGPIIDSLSCWKIVLFFRLLFWKSQSWEAAENHF